MCINSLLQENAVLSTSSTTGMFTHYTHAILCDRNIRQMRYLELLSQTTSAQCIAAMHAEGYSTVGASPALTAVFCCTRLPTACCWRAAAAHHQMCAWSPKLLFSLHAHQL